VPGLAFGQQPRPVIPDLAKIDRQRILTAAERYLHELPVTIAAFPSPRSAGGPHDYFSEGDYWWPDPQNPSGPYIRRDGMSNPDNFTAHRHALIRLSLQAPWNKLHPDPTVEEVIRNYPIRQPLLWVGQGGQS
jgi:Alginate lyase